MTPSNTPSWYIVQFKPNGHKIAVRNLQRQGFGTFLPMHEVTRRTVVKFETVIRPLFAGYMFVACRGRVFWPLAEDWRGPRFTDQGSRHTGHYEGRGLA